MPAELLAEFLGTFWVVLDLPGGLPPWRLEP
jgi:hypothetical protein